MTQDSSRLVDFLRFSFFLSLFFLATACGSVTYENEPQVTDGDDSDGDVSDGDLVDGDTSDGDLDGDEVEDEEEVDDTDGDEDGDTDDDDDDIDGDEDGDTDDDDDDLDGDEDGDAADDDDDDDDDDTTEPVSCRPGERACYYDKLRICNSDGESYTRVLCGDGQICAYDDCRDIICNPGEVICQDGSVYACNAEGIEYTLAEYCTRPSVCQSGTCVSACDSAQVIRQNQLITGSTVGAMDTVYVPSSCTMPTETGSYDTIGPDRLYRISLQAGEAIRVTLTPTTRNYDPSLYLFESCDMMPVDCQIGSDNCCSLTAEEIIYTAPHSGDFFIAVDSWEDAEGDYTLKVSSYAAESTNLRMENVEASTGSTTVTYTGTLVNESDRDLDNVDIGIYFTDEDGTIAESRTPDLVYAAGSVAAGESKDFSILTRYNTNGLGHVVLVADWKPVYYDANRDDNVSPVMAVTFSGGVDDVEIPMNGEVSDRFLGSTSYKWFRFHCMRGHSLMVEVAAGEGSSFDPYVELYSMYAYSRLDNADNDLDTTDAHLMVHCDDDSIYKARVKYSSSASTTARYGSFVARVTPLTNVLARPTLLSLFPGQQTDLTAVGGFDPAVTEAVATINSVVDWAVADENIATVTSTGRVTVNPLVRSGLTDILVIPKDTHLTGVSIPLRVTTTIPGTAYGTLDDLPIDIPAPDALGMTSFIHVDDIGMLDQISVGVSITHSNINQLRVKLISPSGRQVKLHWSEGSGTTLITVYGIYQDPNGDFTPLRGESISGDWILNVVDTSTTATASRGQLNAWQLYLTTVE